MSPDTPNPLTAKDSTISQLKAQLEAVKARNPEVLEKLEAAQYGDFAGFTQDEKCRYLEDELEASIAFVNDEPQPIGELFHSRNPIAGVIQSVRRNIGMKTERCFIRKILPLDRTARLNKSKRTDTWLCVVVPWLPSHPQRSVWG